MNDIKPIETRYQGHRFRSRLEARWACAFDAANIKWEYEKEGYILDDGTPYLPDFWLPASKAWVECKGAEPTETEIARCRGLRDKTGHHVFLSHGLPFENRGTLFCWDIGEGSGGTFEVGGCCFLPPVNDTGTWPLSWLVPLTTVAENRTLYGDVGMTNKLFVLREAGRWFVATEGHVLLAVDRDYVEAMADAARSARFEHGESGAA